MASLWGNIDGVEETEGMLEFGESGMFSSRIHVQVSSSGNFWMGRGGASAGMFLGSWSIPIHRAGVKSQNHRVKKVSLGS